MSLPIVGICQGNINTQGIVPFVCECWEGKPLFIINGGIRGSMFPSVYGTAYKYEDFPWPEGTKETKEKCRSIAKMNNSPQLWVTDEVYKQFKKILANKK